MKFRNSPFLLALALVVSSPLMSHASAAAMPPFEAATPLRSTEHSSSRAGLP
jgi:hypothetical protein